MYRTHRSDRRGRGARARALAPLLALLACTGAAADEQPELFLTTITFVGSEAGQPDLILEAARARFVQAGDVAHLEEVTLDAAGEDGRSSLQMTCDRARLDLSTSDFLARGNVRGTTADGHRFKTEAARFRHAARVIEGDDRVDIVDPSGTRLQGKGFHYDVRAQRMRMRNATVSEFEDAGS